MTIGQNLLVNNDFSTTQIIIPGSINCTDWRTGFNVKKNGAIPANWYSPLDSLAGSQWGVGWHCHACQPTFQQNKEAKPGIYPFPWPHTGIGYAQLTLKDGAPHRGFISQLLPDTLQAGVAYAVEYYVRPFVWSVAFSKNIGVLFTADSLNYYAYQQNLVPHVEATQIITDTTTWTRVIGTYVANGTERFINMGNFRADTASTFVPTGFTLHPFFQLYNIPTYLVDAIAVYNATDTLYTATLPKDTLLCPGEQLVLQPNIEDFKLQDTTTTYLWNTGSTDSSITVTQPGTYWVQTTINSRFLAGDTIVVEYFPPNYTLNLPDTVTFCEGQQATLQATPDPMQLTAYVWNTGAILTGIQTRTPGLYWLQGQTPCGLVQDSSWVVQDFCENYLWIPNAFSPTNQDGVNDYFAFFGAPEPVTLWVYNRWGVQVFYSNNYQNNWDGTFQGALLPQGVYTYVIEYLYVNKNGQNQNPEGSKRQVRGTVSIL